MSTGLVVRGVFAGLFVLAGCDSAKGDGEKGVAKAEEVKAAEPPEKPVDEEPVGGLASAAKKAAEEVEKGPRTPAEKLLDEAVEAMGGREKIETLTSFHSVGRMEVTGQRIKATTEVWWKEGDFYMVSEMEGIGTTRAWKHGDTTWSEDPIMGRRKLEGREAMQAAWGAASSLAFEWKSFFDKAEVGGTRKVDGAEVVDILLTAEDGAEVTYSLDTTTHLPVQQSFAQVTPMGETPATMSFEDYRDVGGIKIPFRIRTSMTIVEAVQIYEAWTPNIPIDDAKFTPPPA